MLDLAVQARVDPTQTTRVVHLFDRDVIKRWRKVVSEIEKAIVEEDGFGYQRRGGAWDIGTINARKFDFPRSDAKVQAFMRWLRKLQDEEVLEIQEGTPIESAAASAWSNKYIQTSYQKGIARSAAQMRKGGLKITDRWVHAAFFRPIHADRVGLLYTRTFSDLAGITKTMDTRISRVLSLGIAEGRSPAAIAKQMRDEVRSIGVVRSRMIARTEIIRAHSEATLNTYEEAGLEEVDVQAEFTTSGDNRVCPRCKALERKNPYSLKQARGLIPVHPNCRCAWIPIVENAAGVEFL